MAQEYNPATPLNTAQPWTQIWIRAITKPSVQTFENLVRQPHVNSGTAYKWMFVSALVSYVFSIAVQWVVSIGNTGAFNQSVPSLTLILCLPFIGGIAAVLGLMINAGITQFIARMFGGTGSHSELVYAQAAFLAPLTFVSTVLGLMPFINLLIFPLLIYQFVLSVITIKAVNQFGWGKALASNAVVWIGLLLLLAFVSLSTIALLGPSVGNVNSNIIKQILTPPP